MLKFFKPLFYLINVVIIIALLAIHFILKESSYKASLFFYTFPLPIIIVIILILSVFIGRRLRKYHLLLAALLLTIWLCRSFKIHIPKTINENDLEIVFWNASRERGFQDAFKLNNHIPDVMVLAEYQAKKLKEDKLKYPEYYMVWFEKEEIGIFSKTPFQIEKKETSKYHSTIVNFKIANINFYAVDVQGSPDVPREWEFAFVDSLIVNKENTIVLGDFNVPYESKHLKHFKTDFNHAFSKKGNGFRETWFWNIPLLSLDHIWVSKDLEVLKTKKVATFKSDHSMLKTFIRQ
ncbi:endonuclease/exonuclease/phosphatase family protein [Flavivirga aquimarina]|uniref:Endonuclease/exonuclease/phosphatase family protein n=1 Tax=Flavivirga aquimarina TaxID=2027862 RepID=A0ABT8W8A4_9FLAO|nr:endonuclease/exonuclease/phosphatase family protein [Flavivirga aquimarina]MDO5969365.1 endonuclease/exonuclease/phosphatase family protein [Flavivirga aquimarina]